MNENIANENIARVLYKNRIKIGLSALIFAIVGGVITMYIPKNYTASAIIYPTRSNNIKDEAKDPNFGLELQADKLTQLFSSDAMFNHIVDKFQLIKYYELDTNNLIWYDKLRKSYFRDISVQRNQYLSLNIIAVMKDAQLAADIVNNMVDYIDTVQSEIYVQNTNVLLDQLDVKVKSQEYTVDSILQLLFENEEFGFNNVLSENRLAGLNENERNGSVQLGDGIIKDVLLKKHTPELEKQINDYYYELGILNKYKLYYAESIEKVDLPFPKVYKVSKAIVNHKKVSPSMSLNILFGFGFGLIFSVSLVLIGFKWKSFNASLD